MTIVKRFVAGVVCPRCAKMDTVRMFRDDVREHRECVACGFEDSLRLDGRPEVKELETRVHRQKPVDTLSAKAAKPEEVKVQTIKWLQ